MDLHNSLFLTERTGLTWVESLHLWDSQRDPVTRKRVWDLHKMRVPTPGDIRCQVISEAAARLAGSDIRVPLNAQRWETRLQVMVLNDHDYVHRFINSHGGSDLDDFFGVMARTIKGEKKFIDYRNPNTRGEYTVWDYVEGDWHPTYTTADGEEVSFPPLNKTQWPKQILEALEDGTTSYLELPSQVNPPVEESLRTFTVEDAKNILKTAYDAEQAGGYGSLELAIEAWFLTHGVTQYRAVMPNSEDAIDKFLDASAVEDQTALLGFKDTILEEVIATGKPVDIMVGTRLGREVKVPLTSNGPVSRIKRITEEVVLDFEKRLGQFIRSLEIPAFLEELGNNEFLTKATEVLRESRSAQWAADRKTLGMEERDRKIANLAAQNEVIMDFILSDEDPAARAQRIMAFWYATRTVRTHTTQRINDQPVFGTKLFREDVEDGEPIFHLLNALIYLGIANEIDADPDGNFITKRTVHYRGNKTWDVECRECGEEYKGKSFAALVQYWNSGGINKHHRQ